MLTAALIILAVSCVLLVAVFMYRLGYKHARQDFTERRTPPILRPADRYKPKTH